MRLGDLDALKKDFEERYKACDKWIEKAKDEEIKIRADATKCFICEVIMTIDNAPTVELTEEQAIDKLHETGWLPKHDKEMTERQKGEWLFTEIDENYHIYGQCSICKERNRIGKFCRSCGADMRKGEKE